MREGFFFLSLRHMPSYEKKDHALIIRIVLKHTNNIAKDLSIATF